MPSSEKSNRAFATASSSCSKPTAAKIGLAAAAPTVGLVLCATTQIEQEFAAVGFG